MRTSSFLQRAPRGTNGAGRPPWGSRSRASRSVRWSEPSSESGTFTEFVVDDRWLDCDVDFKHRDQVAPMHRHIHFVRVDLDVFRDGVQNFPVENCDEIGIAGRLSFHAPKEFAAVRALPVAVARRPRSLRKLCRPPTEEFAKKLFDPSECSWADRRRTDVARRRYTRAPARRQRYARRWVIRRSRRAKLLRYREDNPEQGNREYFQHVFDAQHLASRDPPGVIPRQ